MVPLPVLLLQKTSSSASKQAIIVLFSQASSVSLFFFVLHFSADTAVAVAVVADAAGAVSSAAKWPNFFHSAVRYELSSF